MGPAGTANAQKKPHTHLSPRPGISDLRVSALFFDPVSVRWGGKGREQ